jgi:outer membrane protein OmpA-like peptidoglycan-associated protein
MIDRDMMKGSARRLAVVAALLLSGRPMLVAQQNMPADSSLESFSLGIYGGYGRDFFRSAFAVASNGAITDASDCGRFERGTGGSPIFGVTASMPIDGPFGGRLGIEYQRHAGTLTFPCVDPASIRMPDGSVVPALTDHIVDIDYGTITARLTLDYSPFPAPLRFGIGPALSAVLRGHYDAREDIVTPTNAEFLEGGQSRPYGSNSFPGGMDISLGITGSAAYIAKVSDRLSLVPEISGLLKLTDDIPSAHLRAHTLAATLGLLYRFDHEPAPQAIAAVPPPSPPPPAQFAILGVGVKAEAIGPGGERSDTVRISASRVITTQLHPLLTYLFFAPGDSAIPGRYIRRDTEGARGFDEGRLRGMGTMEIYHNLLDIIGARMKRHPEATITVTGAQPDLPADRGKLPLATARAAGVKSYLRRVWGIDSARIIVAARQEPAAVTNPETEDGAAENRRVEITSATWQITEPVLLADTVGEMSVPAIEVAPQVAASAGVAAWSVDLLRSGRKVGNLAGLGTPPPSLRFPLDTSDAAGATSYEITLHATDSTGRTESGRAVLPAEVRLRRDAIRYGSGTYSLILFDFNSAQLRAEHRRTIAIVNDRTDPSSRVSVYGYTDRLGSDDLNRTLSEGRARAVAAEVRGTVVDVVGKGESTLLYDNTLPEGRFYSRSVTIDTRSSD